MWAHCWPLVDLNVLIMCTDKRFINCAVNCEVRIVNQKKKKCLLNHQAVKSLCTINSAMFDDTTSVLFQSTRGDKIGFIVLSAQLTIHLLRGIIQGTIFNLSEFTP